MHSLPGAEFDQVFLVEQGRAGTDDAHVTFQDAEQLGEFVEAGFAKELANGGEPAVGISQKMGGNSGGVDAHGAEFGHLEDDVVAPYPVGPVEDRTGGCEPDQCRHEEHGEDQEKDGGQCHSKIKGALQHNISSIIVLVWLTRNNSKLIIQNPKLKICRGTR